ncbi:hypothetical protein P6P90_06700 [Ectobacillus antri]|jgi:hypothetical protein|uniref:ACT domain-containing protein n=1 Tax=Ectobacillus antri TaxID=2486280 RepID=A0ABT6H4L6_9BACI|nr:MULTISPECIES: hypothetical protein [Ectobacillus]MDG4658095.1 hypothetical protein [Ectobacillus antri]MDG5753664.1 hypothetical protein [Ectobacillus antri]UOY93298.1 hypothetical protein MUG87_03995 [Ectobacillus sp. JY-23]
MELTRGRELYYQLVNNVHLVLEERNGYIHAGVWDNEEKKSKRLAEIQAQKERVKVLIRINTPGITEIVESLDIEHEVVPESHNWGHYRMWLFVNEESDVLKVAKVLRIVKELTV